MRVKGLEKASKAFGRLLKPSEGPTKQFLKGFLHGFSTFKRSFEEMASGILLKAF